VGDVFDLDLFRLIPQPEIAKLDDEQVRQRWQRDRVSQLRRKFALGPEQLSLDHATDAIGYLTPEPGA